MGSNIIERIGLIGKEVKSYACKDLNMMGESINPAFHAQVVVKRISIKVLELRGVPL